MKRSIAALLYKLSGGGGGEGGGVAHTTLTSFGAIPSLCGMQRASRERRMGKCP